MQPTVLAKALSKYRDHLRRVGVDERPLLVRAALAPVPEAPDARVPFRGFLDFVEGAAHAAGDPALGLHVAEQSPPREYDVLGFAALSSATLGEAFERVVRYFRVWQEGGAIRLDVVGGEARLAYAVDVAPPEGCRQDVEHTLAALLLAGRALVGGAFAPRETSLAHARPGDDAEQSRLFGPVRFGRPENALWFDASWLRAPVRSADPALCALVDGYAAQLLDARPPSADLRERVRAAVVRALQDHEEVEIGRTARSLAMSERSLQRHLADAGTTFSDEVDHARRDLALRHVASNRLALGEIAFLLGYSDATAFARAFRRWSGTSPARYRQERSAA